MLECTVIEKCTLTGLVSWAEEKIMSISVDAKCSPESRTSLSSKSALFRRYL